jgi:translation initiation factor IF-1
VALDNDGPVIIAHIAGRMMRYRIGITVGDRVEVEMTPYDRDRGRIIFRQR